VGLAQALHSDIDGPDQVRIIARLETEQDNLRAALTWAIEQVDAVTALRLTTNLWKLWAKRSRQTVGRDWLERSLAVPGEVPPDLRLVALFAAGLFARHQGDYRHAVLRGEEGLALARASANRLYAARALSFLGLVAHDEGDRVRAQPLFKEALGLAREAGDANVEALILNNLGDTLAAEGDRRAAQAYYEEGLAIWRRRGDSWGMGLPILNLGQLALRAGDTRHAGRLLNQGLAMSREVGDQGRVADYLDAVGRLAAASGQWSPAVRLLSAATALYQTLGIEQFPDHRREHDHAVATAKVGLGNEAFTIAWDGGQALLPEHAVSEALAFTAVPVSETTRHTP
jgi:tetratricopeptide (TPR) repeat protein